MFPPIWPQEYSTSRKSTLTCQRHFKFRHNRGEHFLLRHRRIYLLAQTDTQDYKYPYPHSCSSICSWILPADRTWSFLRILVLLETYLFSVSHLHLSEQVLGDTSWWKFAWLEALSDLFPQAPPLFLCYN